MALNYIVKVTCDKCGESEEIEPETFYRDYSGNTPFIDQSESGQEGHYKQAHFKLIDGKWLGECCQPEPEEED